MNAAFAAMRAQVLSATTPEAVFGDLGDDPGDQHSKGHTLYRRFAKALHPDRMLPEDREEAGQIFARLNALWDEAEKRIKAGTYAKPAPITITTKTATIEVGRSLPAGEIADFFEVRITESGKPATDGILKVARHAADNDLIENEARTLKYLLEAASPEDEKLLSTFRPYFPSFLTSIRIDDGSGHACPGVQRAANVFKASPGYFSLETIVRDHPGAIDPGHMGWMLNRIFESLTYLHGKGVVHGAINPAHLLYNPVSHGLIFTGFGASVIDPVNSDRKVGLVSSAYRDFTAPEILAKQEPGPAADFYGAARSMLFALTGKTDGMMPFNGNLPRLPKSIAGFLKACLLASPRQRLHDAKSARREFGDVLEAIFGPPTYRRLDLSPHILKENSNG